MSPLTVVLFRDEVDVQDSIRKVLKGLTYHKLSDRPASQISATISKIIQSNIESQTGSGASSQSESFGEISFTMKFDLEITNKDGTNRLLINVINCRKIPRIPLVSHPYIKGSIT